MTGSQAFCSALLQVGFTEATVASSLRGLLPHVFTLTTSFEGRFVFCGTFLGVAPTGNYPAPCPAEPGLSSRNKVASGRLVHHDRVEILSRGFMSGKEANPKSALGFDINQAVILEHASHWR
jgi:hypothetical protein